MPLFAIAPTTVTTITITNLKVEAAACFSRVLELEPSNKEAAAGLNVARMQAERQRRQQAGVSID